MIISLNKNKSKGPFRLIIWLVVFTFLSSMMVMPTNAQAQGLSSLPAPGTLVSTSAVYTPTIVAGMTIYPDNPLKFDFLIDVGDDHLEGEELKEESEKLISYFMATLTVPEDEMWVNLSPYEKNRIMADGLGGTVMGRDMLAQDYMLKQLTASMMYPEDELGSEFWQRVYKQAEEQFGTTDIPTNTFNKIWIVPEEAVIYANGTNIFVADSRLKVMMEDDYLNLSHQSSAVSHQPLEEDNSKLTALIKEILIPEIEREVNEGKNFAPLRQIYHSMILATWYKNNLKKNLLADVYIDQNKIEGVDVTDKEIKNKIYDRYLEALKKGVYDYIKEDYDPVKQEIVPRKYFSGGVDAAQLTDQAMTVTSAIQQDSWIRGILSNDNPDVSVTAEIKLNQSPLPADAAMVGSKEGQEVDSVFNDVDQAIIASENLERFNAAMKKFVENGTPGVVQALEQFKASVRQNPAAGKVDDYLRQLEESVEYQMDISNLSERYRRGIETYLIQELTLFLLEGKHRFFVASFDNVLIAKGKKPKRNFVLFRVSDTKSRETAQGIVDVHSIRQITRFKERDIIQRNVGSSPPWSDFVLLRPEQISRSIDTYIDTLKKIKKGKTLTPNDVFMQTTKGYSQRISNVHKKLVQKVFGKRTRKQLERVAFQVMEDHEVEHEVRRRMMGSMLDNDYVYLDEALAEIKSALENKEEEYLITTLFQHIQWGNISYMWYILKVLSGGDASVKGVDIKDVKRMAEWSEDIIDGVISPDDLITQFEDAYARVEKEWEKAYGIESGEDNAMVSGEGRQTTVDAFDGADQAMTSREDFERLTARMRGFVQSTPGVNQAIEQFRKDVRKNSDAVSVDAYLQQFGETITNQLGIINLPKEERTEVESYLTHELTSFLLKERNQFIVVPFEGRYEFKGEKPDRDYVLLRVLDTQSRETTQGVVDVHSVEQVTEFGEGVRLHMTGEAESTKWSDFVILYQNEIVRVVDFMIETLRLLNKGFHIDPHDDFQQMAGHYTQRILNVYTKLLQKVYGKQTETVLKKVALKVVTDHEVEHEVRRRMVGVVLDDNLEYLDEALVELGVAIENKKAERVVVDLFYTLLSTNVPYMWYILKVMSGGDASVEDVSLQDIGRITQWLENVVNEVISPDEVIEQFEDVHARVEKEWENAYGIESGEDNAMTTVGAFDGVDRAALSKEDLERGDTQIRDSIESDFPGITEAINQFKASVQKNRAATQVDGHLKQLEKTIEDNLDATDLRLTIKDRAALKRYVLRDITPFLLEPNNGFFITFFDDVFVGGGQKPDREFVLFRISGRETKETVQGIIDIYSVRQITKFRDRNIQMNAKGLTPDRANFVVVSPAHISVQINNMLRGLKEINKGNPLGSSSMFKWRSENYNKRLHNVLKKFLQKTYGKRKRRDLEKALLQILKAHEVEHEVRRRIIKTSLVGDMDYLDEALAELESAIKSQEAELVITEKLAAIISTNVSYMWYILKVMSGGDASIREVSTQDIGRMAQWLEDIVNEVISPDDLIAQFEDAYARVEKEWEKAYGIEPEKDKAMVTNPGGIDFNAGNLRLKEEGQAAEIDFTNFPRVEPNTINGARPIIINITPITNFPFLLGLSDDLETQTLSALN